ncbi:MAG: hypothetical protein AAF429_03080 [Pseudomonadota bacterium]
MTSKISKMGQAVALSLLMSSGVFAQSTPQESVVNTTQILDTGVLFAIGAREAEQAIRGAFGWPTFQEGFVDKVYFRFDPDGYARFSTSPRLDEDVFEVICAESSTACIAKKNGIEIGLTPNGQIQLRLAGITPQDSFFVSDNNSELPLPPTILEPLDPRLEALLATGGEMLIKREQETVNAISLSGFSAVITYLRWVAQNQDSRVFPRGWPVPAQATATQTSSLTQPGQWQTPTAQPQFAPTTFDQQAANTAVTVQNENGATVFGQQQFQSNLANLNNQQPILATGQAAFGAAAGQASVQNNPAFGTTQSPELSQLQSTILQLQTELQSMRNATAPQGAVVATPSRGASLDWNGAGAVNQPNAPSAQVGTTLPDPSTNGFRSNAGLASQDPHLGPSDFTNLLNRLIAVETKMHELEYSMQNAIRDLQFQSRHVSAAEVSEAAEEGIGDIRPQAIDPTSPEMSPLEKLLLDRLGDAETLTPEEVAKLPSQNQGAQPNQEELIRDLLLKLSATEDLLEDDETVTSETLEETNRTGEEALEDQAQNTDGFVTLSDYINNILKTEGSAQ